ncbi:MAG: putative cytokinetic ring protein SteA [Actinomycetaceae bacterium]|nr:putative cytokinetic ring protein SteA [Actinomycetaceae bacterium]
MTNVVRALFKRGNTASPSEGNAQVDKRTKNLTRRLQAGAIAVINHADIDRVAAESLVEAKPLAVLNAAKSTTGRYPNLGPGIILGAGIKLIDDLGADVMQIKEGTRLRLEGNKIFAGEKLIATGIEQTRATNAAAMEQARVGLSVQIEAFAANTMEYLRRERELLLDGIGVPEVRTKIDGRHVLIVVRGYSYKEDLVSLKSYIREYRPVLVGVDGGADAIIEEGYTPDMIIGDMDSVSDEALRCGAEIVVHAYRDGRAPGTQRLDRQGIDYITFPATGTSEDVAMLLADDKGAELIVALGTHATLIEFLDKGRAGMASTFLTRLRVGSRLVDAKGVSRLYHARISTGQAIGFALVGIISVLVALGVTPAGQAFYGLISLSISNFLGGLFGAGPFLPPLM